MTITPVNRGLYAALLLDEKTWSWNWRYNPSLKDHMHALGVIAANYNDLEGQFYRLFYVIMSDMDAGKLIFSKLNNAERMEVALKLGEHTSPTFRTLFEYFISGFGTLHENRNILMHSKAHNALDKELDISHITLAKQSKRSPHENNFVSLDIQELRTIADDMANFSTFGFDLFMWRLALAVGGTITWADGTSLTPTLPERPLAPRKLVLSPQEAPISAPPQIESSGE